MNVLLKNHCLRKPALGYWQRGKFGRYLGNRVGHISHQFRWSRVIASQYCSSVFHWGGACV